MDLLNFFRARQKPAAAFQHPDLGSMRWVASEREWKGSYNGFRFTIPLERGSTEPAAELLNYAVSLLADSAHLVEALEREKDRWLARYPGSSEEVRPLEFDEFALYRHRGTCRALVFLHPESVRNAWRLEFCGQECEGLGFDS